MTIKGEDRGLFQRGKVWGIRYVDEHGREHREMVGTSKALARETYQRRKAAVAERRFNPEKFRRRVVLLSSALDDYLERRKDRAGIRNMRRIAQRWKDALGTKPLRQVRAADVDRYRAQRAGEVSRQTLYHELSLLRSVFRLALDEGTADAQPVRGLKAPRAHRVRYLSAEEETALLDKLDAKWRPLVTVAIHTGMRQGEQFTLRWRQVDLAARVIRLPKSKSGHPRTIELNETAAETLRALSSRLAPASRHDWVFAHRTGARINARNFYRRVFLPATRAARLTDLRWHDLRHTFASRLVQAGADLRTVADLLGHTSLQMVMRYAHLAPGARRAAVRLLDADRGLTGASTGTATRTEGKK